MSTVRHLSVISQPLDGEIVSISRKLARKVMVGGRSELEQVLCDLVASQDTEPPPTTLDLIGHSTSDHSLLRLGYWIIDGGKLTVSAFFRELADCDVLGRLGVTAVRLLGCETAVTAQGKATLRVLADILGVEVFGTREMLSASHYDETGFRSECDYALVSSRNVTGCAPIAALLGSPFRRSLDLDALPASPLTPKPWPARIADLETATALVRMIRRDQGAYMPDLDENAQCDVCLPANGKPGWYIGLQVVLGGAFVRVYPDAGKPGVVFPVDDPQAFYDLIKELPLAGRVR
jgi:hypothetical protein